MATVKEDSVKLLTRVAGGHVRDGDAAAVRAVVKGAGGRYHGGGGSGSGTHRHPKRR